MHGLRGMAAEGWTTLVCLVGLGALVGLGEALRRWGVSEGTTRRLVHAGVSLFIVLTPLWFVRPLPVYGLAGLFVVLNAAARTRHWWPGIHAARPASWGTVALPLAVLPALAATWSVSPDRIYALQAAFLILAVADPLASAVGEAYGRRPLLADASRRGSGVFFGGAFLLAGGLLLGSADLGPGRAVGSAAAVALVATAVEAISRDGWDNLFAVLAVLLVLVPLESGRMSLPVLGLGLLVGGGVGSGAVWSRALTTAAGVGAGLFAASLVALGGWAWVGPGVAFFVLSSALSWLPGGTGDEADASGPARSLRQVMANGGVAWALLGVAAILPPGSEERALCYVAFLGALAAAAADTWATELGARLSGRPWSLRTGRRVVSGTSGAVSPAGTGAAVLGAFSVVGVAGLGGGMGLGLAGLGAAGCAGLVGMVVDSIAGATIQAQYRDPVTDTWAEVPQHEEPPARGWARVDNEIVNLLCTGTGAAAALLFWGALG